MKARTSGAERAFVVQFAPDADAEAGRFEGRVEQVASGDGVRFGSLEELVGFIRRILTAEPDAD